MNYQIVIECERCAKKFFCETKENDVLLREVAEKMGLETTSVICPILDADYYVKRMSHPEKVFELRICEDCRFELSELSNLINQKLLDWKDNKVVTQKNFDD